MKTTKSQRGQGLIEYLIIVAIIGVGTLGIMRVMGQTLSAQFATVTYALQGKRKEVAKVEITDSHTSIKDLGNFMNGSADNKSNRREK